MRALACGRGRKAVNIYGFLSVKKLPGWHPTCAHPLLAQAAALLEMTRYSSARKVTQKVHAVMSDSEGARGGGLFGVESRSRIMIVMSGIKRRE